MFTVHFFVFRKRSSICPSLLDKSPAWRDASFSARRTSELHEGDRRSRPDTHKPASRVFDPRLRLLYWTRGRSNLLPPAPPHYRDGPAAMLTIPPPYVFHSARSDEQTLRRRAFVGCLPARFADPPCKPPCKPTYKPPCKPHATGSCHPHGGLCISKPNGFDPWDLRVCKRAHDVAAHSRRSIHAKSAYDTTW
jgi:hypothetical protein